LSQMGEAQRLTKLVQTVSVVVSVVYLLSVFLLIRFDLLAAESVFILLSIQWFAASIFVVVKLRFDEFDANVDNLPSVLREYWQYCLPLIPYAWIGFLYEFADRWLLQRFGGAVEQAYYSIAFQFGAIAAIATTSILNIFWKEIAELYSQNNVKKMQVLVNKVISSMYFVATVISFFLLVQSENIISVLLGEQYLAGKTTLAIMFLYPIHQSIGQLLGALAYATGQVGLYVNVGIFMMVGSVFSSYVILSNGYWILPGLGLGSFGLAIKMVALQLISVTVLQIFLCRKLSLRIYWTFQFVVPAVCLVAAALSSIAGGIIFHGKFLSLLQFFAEGSLYLCVVLAFIVFCPRSAGFSPEDISRFAQIFKPYFKLN